MNSERPTANGVYIRPDVRRKRISVERDDDRPVRVAIAGQGDAVESNEARIVVPFPEFTPWTPANPERYRVECVDTATNELVASDAFGMREFTIKDRRFHLNGRPYFVRAATPVSVHTESLARIRDAGFNAVQLGRNSLTEEALELTDTSGVFVVADLSGEPDFADIVRAHRNRPSVVIWLVDRGADALHALDPSRIVIENDPTAAPRAFAPYHREAEPMDMLTFQPAAPLSQRAEAYARHAGSPDRLSFIHLVGGIATRYDAAATESVEPIYGALAGAASANPNFAGYRVPVGDLLSAPDTAVTSLRDAQRDLRPVIRLAKTNLVPREEVEFSVAIANLERFEGEAAVSLQIVGPTNQVLWKKKRNVRIPRHARELWEGNVAASGATGPHAFVVRLMIAGRPMIEERRRLYVFDPAQRADVETYVSEPSPTYAPRCRSLMREGAVNAPVLVVPPLANSVRAYPDDELMQALGDAYTGAVALVFGPPDDWNDFADHVDPGLRATSRAVIRDGTAPVHVNRLHPVFEGLPAGGVMGEAYRDILPWRTFAEDSEEDISSGLTTGGGPEAGANVLVRSFGSGRVVFTHLRILERLGHDPVADRLFTNMLRHFSRRAVPSEGSLPVHTRAVEWLRRERAERMRKWKVIGPFQPASDADEAYPPEQTVELAAVYPGTYRDLAWTDWHTNANDNHELDFAQALEDGTNAVFETPGVAYAYAEFAAEQRTRASIRVCSAADCVVWLNDKRIADDAEELLRQGRNTLLLKARSQGRGCRAAVAIEPAAEAAPLHWWR